MSWTTETVVFELRPYLKHIKINILKVKYRKIPKISPGAYIFQRFFLRGLSTERNLRFKIDWASLMIVGRKFTLFALFYFMVYEDNFKVQATEGLTFGGAFLWRAFCVTSLKSFWEELTFGILGYSSNWSPIPEEMVIWLY